jgi:uncharacterized protein (TIGR02597 family)
MNATSSLRLPLCALTAVLSFGLGFDAYAQSVSTTPVGAVTLTIAAGSGSSRVVTPLSFPLVDSASGVGLLKGQITGFSANSLSNSSAGWVAGQFSDPAIPYFVRITSGSAAGRTFLISTSTASTTTGVTIDSEEAGLVDLTTTGLVVGDSYAIFPCDTLASLFGTPASTGVAGGTSATGAGADIVYVMVSGGWRQYYYNTGGTPGWKRIGLNTASDNIPVRPDSLILYSRIGDTAMSLVLMGEVPASARKQIVRRSGVTPLANPWPAGVTTLSSSHIADMTGWAKNADYTQADIVLLMVSGGWRQYFHDGVNWRRVGLNSISDGVEIPIGSGVQINKRGSDVSSVDVSPVAPYTL